MKGQVAVVTGASSGIGRAIALDLAHHGVEICLVARRTRILESVAAEIRGIGGQAHVDAADLARDHDILALVEAVRQRFEGIDMLVLCSGVIFHGTTEQGTLDQLDLQYRLNVRAHYALVQGFLPSLRKQRGQIVFINSTVATRPASASIGQFAATQVAMRAIADSLRDEVNADGIRVLSVYPGRTATPRMEPLFEREGKVYKPELLLQPEDVAMIVRYALSMPRTAEVTDIKLRSMVKSY